MDERRSKAKQEVLAANRGPFGGWWEDLLDVDPELMLRVHRHMLAAEAGPLPRFFRHLIILAVDCVVTHLYPRGVGVHARVAMEHGATPRQVVEALQISSFASNRGWSVALPLVLEELEAAGRQATLRNAEKASEVRSAFEAQVGEWRDWMVNTIAPDPDALKVVLELGFGTDGGDGLDAKKRELLLLAVAACPALVDQDAIRRHTRQALKLGAAPDEIVQTVKVANVIALHPIVEGIPQLRAVLNAG